MTKHLSVLALVVSYSLNAMAADKISVVGLDKNGNTVQTEISSDQFMERFGAASVMVHEQTLKSLQNIEHTQEKLGKWSLRSISVGLGIGFSFGLGPVLNVSTTPRVRLVYSNSTDAPMP